MQVDPIKPILKVPKTTRLNLKYHELLSDFASKFKLRRYTLALPAAAMTHDAQAVRDERNGNGEGGVCARVSYLANVAAAIADDFLTRLRRRVAANDAFGALAVGSGQGLTLVPISAQLELTLPISALLKLIWSPIQPR
jgi:hypothetical protein